MMRARSHFSLVGGLLLLITSTVRAQEPERHLSLNVFGGATFGGARTADDEAYEENYAFSGWEAGATVFLSSKWLGISGHLGRGPISGTEETLFHYAIGPRFIGPYMLRRFPTRLFAHILLGGAHASGGTSGASANSAQLLAGYGIDLGLFGRLQVDYMRLDLPGWEKNDYRAFLGGVVPICFRQCQDFTGLIVRKGAP